MPYNSLDEQEYSGFRRELVAIIQARYTILGLVIAALGVVTGFILTSTAIIISFGQPFTIQLLSPYLYSLILLPSILITFLLTVHFRRIDAYLWARYESEGGLLFQRAYDRFRASCRFHPAYTQPLLWTYTLLAVFALSISLFVNFDVVTSRQQYWQWPLIGMLVLILGITALWVLIAKYAGRNLTQRYRRKWSDSLDYLQSNPAAGTTVAVFLDRDGVINENRDAGVTSLGLFKFIPKAKKALGKLSQEGFSLIVVTNQPYIGNHQMTEEDLDAIHQHMEDEIWKAGGYIRKIYTCPHPENHQCSCRKPNTRLFEQAAKELKVNLNKSWAIGDQVSDIKAGNDIGARTILVLTGEGEKARAEIANYVRELQPYRIAHDIGEAADIIVKEDRATTSPKPN